MGRDLWFRTRGELGASSADSTVGHHHGVGVCSLEPVSPNSVTIDVPEPRAAYRPATLAVSVFDHVFTPTIIPDQPTTA